MDYSAPLDIDSLFGEGTNALVLVRPRNVVDYTFDSVTHYQTRHTRFVAQNKHDVEHDVTPVLSSSASEEPIPLKCGDFVLFSEYWYLFFTLTVFLMIPYQVWILSYVWVVDWDVCKVVHERSRDELLSLALANSAGRSTSGTVPRINKHVDRKGLIIVDQGDQMGWEEQRGADLPVDADTSDGFASQATLEYRAMFAPEPDHVSPSGVAVAPVRLGATSAVAPEPVPTSAVATVVGVVTEVTKAELEKMDSFEKLIVNAGQSHDGIFATCELKEYALTCGAVRVVD